MSKSSRGGVFNGPSKTGNPSGKGRGNNPPSMKGDSWALMGLAGLMECDVFIEPAKDSPEARKLAFFACTIRNAREDLPEPEAIALERQIRSHLNHPLLEQMLTEELAAYEDAEMLKLRKLIKSISK